MTFTTYDSFKEAQRKQNEIIDKISDQLNSYPKGEMGLIPDSIKNTKEFKE